MISIVIPLYNKENTIRQTIESVFRQTFQDYELIIVDDGSTDNSYEIASSIKDNRIRVLHQENSGVSVARNKGIEESRGDFIAFLDADDEWDENYLQSQIDTIRKYPEAAVFGTNYRFRNSKGRISDTILNRLKIEGNRGIITNYFEIASLSHVPIWTSAVIIKKVALLEVGCFPVGIKSGEDLLTWAKLACKYKIAYLKDAKATYNLDDAYQLTSQPVRRQDNNDPVGVSLYTLYKTHSKIPYFRSYLSHWHKMRASVAIRFGERKETIKESLISLRYNPMNYKVIPFIILALIPKRLRFSLIKYKAQQQ